MSMITNLFKQLEEKHAEVNLDGRFAEQAISELACASVSERVFMQNLSYENEFDLHENEHVGGEHFHMNGWHEDSF